MAPHKPGRFPSKEIQRGKIELQSILSCKKRDSVLWPTLKTLMAPRREPSRRHIELRVRVDLTALTAGGDCASLSRRTGPAFRNQPASTCRARVPPEKRGHRFPRCGARQAILQGR